MIHQLYAGDYDVPNRMPQPALGSHLSVDALNQLFYEVRGGGGCLWSSPPQSFGMGSDDLELLVLMRSDLRFTTAPLLAPVIVDQNGMLELQLGDLGFNLAQRRTEQW